MEPISIEDGISPYLETVYSELVSKRGVLNTAAHAVFRCIRDHLSDMELGTTHHATAASLPGGAAERIHVYEQAARGMTLDVGAIEATITIHDKRVALQYYGLSGVVAQTAKYLTVPAIASAYGHIAHPDELRFGIAFDPETGGNRPALVERLIGERNQRGSGRRTPQVYFWLIPEANHDADPSVLPSEDTVKDAVADAVNDYLARMFHPEA